jgi:hypothetical protein
MIDALLIFDGTLDTTGAAGPTGVAITVTRTSTNVIDFAVARDVGVNSDLEVHVVTTTAFAAAGAATLQIEYQTSADNATWVGVLDSPTYAVADLVVGALIMRYKVPLFQLNDKGTPNRYHRLNYTVATGPMTAGAVTSFITGMDDRNNFIPYGPNYSEL